MRKKKYSFQFILHIAVLLMMIGLLSGCGARFQLPESTVTLEAGTEFIPTDYITARENTKTADISVIGSVETRIPGDYSVTYRLGKYERVLQVTVADTISPVITLRGDSATITVTEGDTFVLTDYLTVTDATETTLTLDTQGQDISKPGTYNVSAEATDAAGNRSGFPLCVVVDPLDGEAPTIHGAGNCSVNTGSGFDPQKGVTVTDNLDPAPKLEIDSSKLNLSKPGTYTVTYTARDAAGNETVIKRKITVADKAPAPTAVTYTPEGGSFGWDATGIAKQPYLVAVNRACCTTTVYGKDGDGNYTVPVKAIVCSVARAGHTTPTGRFTTSDRYEWCLMVDKSYGRYAIRIHNGIMFHSVCYFSAKKSDLEYEEYNKLGSPASLGCIRMSVADEKWLYDNCPRGFPVVIYDDPALPGPLGKPTPIHIDPADTLRRGWDPTDWDDKNPWKQ